MYDEVFVRYREVFDTRDALLRMIASRPAIGPPEDGQMRRAVVTELMHQTATTVITDLQTAISRLPSTSSG